MQDLGFPEGAVEVIAGLYTNCIPPLPYPRSGSDLQKQSNQERERHNTRRYLVLAPLLKLH